MENKNFYTNWTDEELKDVIIPLMEKMGLPRLKIEDYRWFSLKDSEAIFMSQSLSNDLIKYKFNTAVKYYNTQKVQKNFSVKSMIDRIWENWENLDNLFATTDATKIIQERPRTTHEIINNVGRGSTSYTELVKHIESKNNHIEPLIESIYTGKACKQTIQPNSTKEKDVFDINKYYTGDGM